MKSKMLLVITLAAIFIYYSKLYILNQQKPWTVPDSFSKKANPVKADAASISTARTYGQNTASHAMAKQEREMAQKLQSLTPTRDFTTADTQGESDGALFYKTSEGRGDMPSFKKKIPDEEDIWSLVNYIRTLRNNILKL
jgi:hypothetical protein